MVQATDPSVLAMVVVTLLVGIFIVMGSSSSSSGSSGSSRSRSRDESDSDDGGSESSTDVDVDIPEEISVHAPSEIDVNAPDKISVDVPDEIEVGGGVDNDNIQQIVQSLEQIKNEINSQDQTLVNEIENLLEGNLAQNGDGPEINIGMGQQQEGVGVSPYTYQALMQQLSSIQVNQHFMQQMMMFINQSNSTHINEQFIQQMIVNVIAPERETTELPDKLQVIIEIIENSSLEIIVKQQLIQIIKMENITEINIDLQVIQMFRMRLLKMELNILKQYIRNVIQFIETQNITVINQQVLVQIIEINVEEGEDHEPRNRWQMIGLTIENDTRITDQLKDQLFDLLMLHRGSGYESKDLPMQKVYSIRKAFAAAEKNEVKKLTKNMLDFIVNKGIKNIDANTANEIQSFLHQSVDTTNGTTSNDIKGKTPDSTMPSTSDDVKATLSDLRNVKQLEVDLEKELEDFRHHLQEFEKIYEKNEEVFEAVDQIQFTNYSPDAPPQELYSTVKKLDQRVTMDLADPQAAQNLQNAVEAMREHLKACLNELEQMEVDIKKELGQITDAEAPMNDLEGHVNNLETLVDILKTFNADQ